MTNGKGDQRRPTQIDDTQFEFNWNQTFSTTQPNPTQDDRTKILTTTQSPSR